MGIQINTLTQGKNPWEKEYIDFEFDGKFLSEFNLVAVSDGDRYSFQASPDFNDDVSEVKGVSGQHYWGTNFKTLKRTFSLSTDGMTEAELNAFKRHFQPGKYGKFVDSHLAYRYSYCRVAEVTKFTLIPFQKEKTILGRKIKINEYKGEATLTLIWDYPYSFSFENYINSITDDNYEWALRAIFNNGIPIPQSWVIQGMIPAETARLDYARLNIMILDNNGEIISTLKSCHLGSNMMLAAREEQEGSVLVNDSGHSGEDELIYYNPSTNKSPSKIIMSYTPEFTTINSTSWVPVYFNNIADDINSTVYTHKEQYNTIRSSIKKDITTNKIVELPSNGQYINKFLYSSPNVIHSINRCIQIAYQCFNKNTITLLELSELLRDEITHNEILTWAFSVLNVIQNHEAGFVTTAGVLNKEKKLSKPISLEPFGLSTSVVESANWFIYFNLMMLLFFGKSLGSILLEENKTGWIGFNKFQITFDGKESCSHIKYSYNTLTSTKIIEENQKETIIWDITNFTREEENCGDMSYSAYLELDGGDAIDEYGEINSCHFIQFLKGGVPQNVENATLEYNYIYL